MDSIRAGRWALILPREKDLHHHFTRETRSPLQRESAAASELHLAFPLAFRKQKGIHLCAQSIPSSDPNRIVPLIRKAMKV